MNIDQNFQNSTETRNDGNTMLLPVVLEAIHNDVQMKALYKWLNDLIQNQSLKYILKTNCELEAVHSEEYNKLFAKFIEQIEHRQSQVVSAYNCDNVAFTNT